MPIQIRDKDKCCGCYSCMDVCAQKCITMQIDNEGFWYPNVNITQCIDCGICEKSCPMLDVKRSNEVPLAYAAINKDEKIRLNSSSGGIFYALAEHVISKGGIVFGAAMSNDCTSVIHISAHNMKELQKLQGSKYLQSKIGDTYSEAKVVLETGKIVMFTGTPCQIAGLRSFLKREYINLITVDIICHGVPSPELWKKYIGYIEKKNNSIVKSVNFRYKQTTGQDFGIRKMDEKHMLEYTSKDMDSFMQMFLKNYCLRPSCYACTAKESKLSDITIGDFGGIEKIEPDMNDGKGISVVLIRSDCGRKTLETIKNKLMLKEIAYEVAVSENSAENVSVKRPKERTTFFGDMNHLSFNQLQKKYLPVPIKTKIYRKLAGTKNWAFIK